jgi:hypothetical protein
LCLSLFSCPGTFADTLYAQPKETIADTVLPATDDTSAVQLFVPSPQKERSFFDNYKPYDKTKTAGSFLSRFLEWLAELLFDKTGPDDILAARSIIIWSVIVVSLVIIIWLLSRSQVSSLIKPTPAASSFNFSDITEDLDAINFTQKISEAVKENNYRLAIRWHYLKILFLLDKKELIRFAPHKTNIDYNGEIQAYEKASSQKDLTLNFRNLSRIYEFVWYGQFNVKENDYKIHESDFNSFESVLNAKG